MAGRCAMTGVVSAATGSGGISRPGGMTAKVNFRHGKMSDRTGAAVIPGRARAGAASWNAWRIVAPSMRPASARPDGSLAKRPVLCASRPRHERLGNAEAAVMLVGGRRMWQRGRAEDKNQQRE
jgi:hypothetical protein